MSEPIRNNNALLRLLLIGGFFVAVLCGSFVLAQFVLENETAKSIVESFGYVGVGLLSLLSGLNPFLPVPAATFTPVFEAAGLALPFIIVALVLGVMLADVIGFSFGSWSKDSVATKYPELYAKFSHLAQRRKRVVIPVIFLYAALMPLPNELLLIPLGVAGYRFKILILPLILGNTLHQVLLAYGITGLFELIV